MFRTFVIGILLGLMVAGGVAYFVPAVNQHREASHISVQPNGGNRETFHMNIPDDRILDGGNTVAAVPEALKWPASLADSRTQLFKVRNERGAVIGVASRVNGPVAGSGRVLEWAVHLPARGTLYMTLQPEPDASGNRLGELRAGTREFARLRGSVSERLIAVAAPESDDAAPTEQIVLVTARVGTQDIVQ